MYRQSPLSYHLTGKAQYKHSPFSMSCFWPAVTVGTFWYLKDFLASSIFCYICVSNCCKRWRHNVTKKVDTAGHHQGEFAALPLWQLERSSYRWHCNSGAFFLLNQRSHVENGRRKNNSLFDFYCWNQKKICLMAVGGRMCSPCAHLTKLCMSASSVHVNTATCDTTIKIK